MGEDQVWRNEVTKLISCRPTNTAHSHEWLSTEKFFLWLRLQTQAVLELQPVDCHHLVESVIVLSQLSLRVQGEKSVCAL